MNIFNADENDFKKIKVTFYCGEKYPSAILFNKLIEEKK